MSIHRYQNNVFTHGGQTSVRGFGGEIALKAGDIGSIPKLVVYAGYHGDTNGDYDRDFSHPEVMATMGMKGKFRNTILRLVKGRGMTDQEITDAVQRGNVFFTWCDSDNKVRAVMGGGMPVKIY